MANNLDTLLHKIKSLQKQVLPFVVFKSPNSSELCLLWQNTAHLFSFNSPNAQGFVMAPFSPNAPAHLLVPDGKMKATLKTGVYKIPVSQGHQAIEQKASLAKTKHTNLVAAAVNEIKKGAFKKVVLARAITHKTDKPPLETFLALAIKYPAAFCYWWSHPKTGAWQGATPETLMILANNTLDTVSLAGTQKVTSLKPFWGQKEQEEQAIVTQDLTNSLKKIGALVSVNNPESVQAGAMWHLKSKISATVSNIEIGALIAALHPSPAICGLPRAQALAFINSKEDLSRSFYAGYLGLVNYHGIDKPIPKEQGKKNILTSAALFVNLRCMAVHKDHVKIYVGSGITRDSDPIKEWEETQLKALTMKSVLNA